MIVQLVARRSHNPKVVSSILTHRISYQARHCAFNAFTTVLLQQCMLMYFNFQDSYQAVIEQLVARRSHNPKVVSSILTRRIFVHA